MYGIVYVTVNKINGKRYIGQHKTSREKDSYLGSGKILKEAIKTYGRKNFERYTLYRAETEEELDQKEIEFISAFNATHNPKYYNINEGGNVNRMCGENNPMYGKRGSLAPWYGRRHTDEEKELMREHMTGENNPNYGKTLSQEQREKISKSTKGKKHWHYGQHWSDEVKEKISKAHIGKPGWAKDKIRTPEHCLHISESKKGKKPNFSEETWKKISKVTTERNHTEKFKQQVSDANRRFHEEGGRRGASPVVCIETEIVYASIFDAARAINKHGSTISSVLHGRQKTAGGYHWRLATEDERVGELVTVA